MAPSTASSATFDCVGVGSAIVDIIGRCDDAFLKAHNCPKGGMQLISADQMAALTQALGSSVEASGGSVANTMAGIASFGGKAAFIGRIADDAFGATFARDIRGIGVTFDSKPVRNTKPTSRSLILVTPDGERTMNTYLGVSTDLATAEIDANTIGNAKIVYLEGYLFDQPAGMDAFRAAARLAKQQHRKVALSLSDSFCVGRHRAEFLKFIKADVDILFANETEITALYETPHFDMAAKAVAGDVALAALTRGKDGSMLVEKGHPTRIPAGNVSSVVDTTGAGDLYAAGVLFGLARGAPLETAGKLGSLAAAEVISHLGARPAQSLAKLAAAAHLI